jgi:hypothetical protein
MLKKKKCPRCNRKNKPSFDFCPHCGNQLNKNMNRDYGMLGKTDSVNQLDLLSKSLFGSGMLGKMLGGTMKMLEKEMRNMQNNAQPNPNIQPQTNFQMFVNGKPVNMGKAPQRQEPIKELKEKPSTYLSKEKNKEFAKLPLKEPTTNLKRLSDKIIYELKMPGVKSLDDTSIVRLENSIEVKALSKTKAYSKIINIGLPIIDYELEKGILSLELKN